MKRFVTEKLEKWAFGGSRKPLVLSGARQVGKTWILKEFGRTHFARCAYVNFERHPELVNLFEGAFDFRRILTGLQAASGVQITPGDTLVILDEVQLCGAALTGLKYWREEHNDYIVAAAGSLVGSALMEGAGYPVGKTNSMTLYPMSFGEFLLAIGEERLWDVAVSGDGKLLAAFGDRLRDLLKAYFPVGGMPAAVETYARTLSLEEVRGLQGRFRSPGRRAIRRRRWTFWWRRRRGWFRLRRRRSAICRRSRWASIARSSLRRSASARHWPMRRVRAVSSTCRFMRSVRQWKG